VPPPRSAASEITDVTEYQGQALVTREVIVPEGDGTVEIVVTPMPPQAVDSSLYTDGADGLRVLSTRFRTRAIEDDTRLLDAAASGRGGRSLLCRLGCEPSASGEPSTGSQGAVGARWQPAIRL
jgi:hypothetical protein